jgi:hypothetical protein
MDDDVKTVLDTQRCWFHSDLREFTNRLFICSSTRIRDVRILFLLKYVSQEKRNYIALISVLVLEYIARANHLISLIN